MKCQPFNRRNSHGGDRTAAKFVTLIDDFLGATWDEQAHPALASAVQRAQCIETVVLHIGQSTRPLIRSYRYRPARTRQGGILFNLPLPGRPPSHERLFETRTGVVEMSCVHQLSIRVELAGSLEITALRISVEPGIGAFSKVRPIGRQAPPTALEPTIEVLN